jgi:hypothetical protein
MLLYYFNNFYCQPMGIESLEYFALSSSMVIEIFEIDTE